MISLPKIVKSLNANFKDSIFLSFAAPVQANATIDDSAQAEKSKEIRADSAPVPNEILSIEIAGQRKQIIENAHAEAHMIISEALHKATKLENENLAKCRLDAQRIKDEAYNTGLTQGKATAALALQSKLEEVTLLLDRIDDKQREIIDNTENDLKLLVIEIVHKIIGKEISDNDKTLLEIVKKSLTNYKNADWVKIIIAQTDAQVSCITDKKLLASMLDISGSITIETVKDAASGTCIVETSDGLADASVLTQLSNLRQILMNKDN